MSRGCYDLPKNYCKVLKFLAFLFSFHCLLLTLRVRITGAAHRFISLSLSLMVFSTSNLLCYAKLPRHLLPLTSSCSFFHLSIFCGLRVLVSCLCLSSAREGVLYMLCFLLANSHLLSSSMCSNSI